MLNSAKDFHFGSGGRIDPERMCKLLWLNDGGIGYTHAR